MTWRVIEKTYIRTHTLQQKVNHSMWEQGKGNKQTLLSKKSYKQPTSTQNSAQHRWLLERWKNYTIMLYVHNGRATWKIGKWQVSVRMWWNWKTYNSLPVLNKLNMKYDAEFALIFPKGFKSMLSKHFHTTIHNSTVTVAQRWPTTRYIKV